MSRYPTRKYVILTADEVGDVDFDAVMQDSLATTIRNVAGTMYVVKYEGSKPQCLRGKDTLTHSQIKVELEKSEWGGDTP